MLLEIKSFKKQLRLDLKKDCKFVIKKVSNNEVNEENNGHY